MSKRLIEEIKKNSLTEIENNGNILFVAVKTCEKPDVL